MNIVLTIVLSILVFGAAIFVHELGHFATAKLSGIKVNEFALGMGPVLLKKQIGETQYSIRLLPIGGFVQMEGEDEESDDGRGFQKAAMYKRFIVMVAGAFMNMVLGFLALLILVTFNGRIATSTVASFSENASTQASGLRLEDEIISVNGRRCFIVNDIFYEFARTQNGTVDLVVIRDGKKVNLDNVVFATSPAKDGQTGEEQKEMIIDFKVYGKDPTFGAVISEAWNTTLSFSRLIYLSLFDLVTGRMPLNQLSGPVGIVTAIGQAASIGWQPVVQLLALISINLGIVNMLPIPAMDGGRVLLLIVEAIRRKPLKQKVEIAVNTAGFALMMLLMVAVFFNDIIRLIP